MSSVAASSSSDLFSPPLRLLPALADIRSPETGDEKCEWGREGGEQHFAAKTEVAAERCASVGERTSVAEGKCSPKVVREARRLVGEGEKEALVARQRTSAVAGGRTVERSRGDL